MESILEKILLYVLAFIGIAYGVRTGFDFIRDKILGRREKPGGTDTSAPVRSRESRSVSNHLRDAERGVQSIQDASRERERRDTERDTERERILQELRSYFRSGDTKTKE